MEKVFTGEELFLHVKEVSFYLRAINNPIRQNILKLLEERPNLTVTQILIHLRLVQSVTSQHLALLRRSKMVTTNRKGKNIYYNLNTVRLQQVHQFVRSILQEV